MKNLYLILNLGSIIIPFIFSFHPKLKFNKEFKYAWPAIFIVAIGFIVWDMYFTHLGVWGFNPKYHSGIEFNGLPLEEILFFICIPFSCLFTYHCLNKLVNKDIFLVGEKYASYSLLVFLSIMGAFSFGKLYTFSTFSALLVCIILIKFVLKVDWLSRFYFSYSVLLIPFTIVNGVLTGTGIPEPVVWYNNSENLAIRFLTIPIEDVFYGMMLILLNVAVFEYLQKRFKKSEVGGEG
jgi:lycopene cyclase domain-containing protein